MNKQILSRAFCNLLLPAFLALALFATRADAQPTFKPGGQPTGVVATVGDPAVFQVKMNGTPPFSFQWRKNGSPIFGATQATLTIDPVADTDVATYSVIVTNAGGSITSSNALLTVVEPDIIATLPLASPVNTCTNITLSVVTHGTDSPLQYQWYLEGVPIGPNSSSLTISGVQADDAGYYTVAVSNSAGSFDTADGTLTVTDPAPVALAKNITVYLGANGTISITAGQVDNGSYDNCSIASESVSPNTFNCSNYGTNNPVTLTVTDSSNQVSTASAVVTVLDTNAPVVVFHSISVQLDPTGNYTLTPADVNNIGGASTASCGTPAISVSPTSFNFCNVGSSTPVVLTATDIYGNTASVTNTITVLAPVASPSVVYVDSTYPATCQGVSFPSGGSSPYYLGFNAFKTVQAAVNAVAANGTVQVAAGTYTENVSVNKAVTLQGANYGISGCASRGAESIINGGTGSALTIAADGVTVDGFALQGAVGLLDVGHQAVVVQNNAITTAAAGVEVKSVAPTATAGVTIQNNCVTLTGQLASGSPTAGVAISGVGGTAAPVVSGNNISGAFYGYLLSGLAAPQPTIIAGGTITGAMQGVSVFNLNLLTFTSYVPSTFEVNGVAMSGFTGSYPALSGSGNDFQAGVYVFTGGNNTANAVTGLVTNVTVTGTGSISPDSAGLYFTDFSTAAGTMQNITVVNSTVQTNSNRGVFISGSKAVVTITQSSITANGSNPFGTGGNNGYGIIARNNAQVTISNCYVVNPSTVTAPYTVSAVEADANTGPLGPTVVVTNCSIVNNGNSSGYLATQDAGTLNASGNWWGTTNQVTIAGLMHGTVDFTPYLDSGNDTDAITAGFQGDFSVLHVTPLGAQTGGGGRIQEGINDVVGGKVILEAGLFVENVLANKPSLELAGVGQALVTIVPALSAPNPCPGGGSLCGGESDIILVQASAVAIHDLTLDGHNPAMTSGVISGGVDLDARNGIIEDYHSGTFNDTTVYNVTVQNIYLRGIYASSSGTGFFFHDNTVQNVQADPSSIAMFNFGGSGIMSNNVVSAAGDALSANWSSGTTFANNTITASGSGVHTDNSSGPDVLTGNNVSAMEAGAYGVWVFSPYGSIAVSSNIIASCAIGLGSFGQGDATSPQFFNNQVTAGAGAGNAGIYESTSLLGYGFTAVSSVFQGNTVNNTTYGIYLDGESGSPLSASITANNIVTGNQYGIYAAGSPASVKIENTDLRNNSIAAIVAISNAIVDAGNCGSDVTGLGASVGGNNLTGYLTGGAKAVINSNAGGNPAAYAYNDIFGATVLQPEITSAFTGNVLASQAGGLLVMPPSGFTVQCFGLIPSAANSLSGFVSLGGAASATAASVTSTDGALTPGPFDGTVTRTYTLTDVCGQSTSKIQTITVQDTTPPIVTSWPTNRTLNVNGQCEAPVPDLTGEVVGASDNCGSVSVTQSPVASTLVSLGTTVVTVTVSDPTGNAISNTVTLTIVDTNSPAITYVDAGYAGLPAGTVVTWPYVGGSGARYIGCDAFATIQGGINRVAANGTVNVAAGSYAEDLTIAQPMSLVGPNAAINPNTSTRVPEAVIYPGTSDPDPLDDTYVVVVNASGVSFSGFTIDGDNPTIHSGAELNGADLDASEGIGNFETVGSISVLNNVVRNFSVAGIDFENAGPATSANYIQGNKVYNLGYAPTNFPYGYGIGIIIYNNFYADVSSNVITQNRVGIQTGNFYSPNPGTVQDINNNTITSIRRCIFHNLHYAGASTFTISNNYVTVEDSTNVTRWDGITLSSLQGSVGVNAISNTVVATVVTQPTVGYQIWNVPSTAGATITGGVVSNANYGVWINNYQGYGPSAGDSTSATIGGVNISGASIAGVYVQDDPAAANGSIMRGTVTGNTVITGSGLGVWVQGANAGATVLNNNASISSNNVGVQVDKGVALIQNNDLTGNTTAGIEALNGAIVDAGNCTGTNVTGLGISTGGNNLSGYSFNNVAPFAIENFNASGTPVVLAENDNFGALAGTNIATDFNNPAAVTYSQNPLVATAPADATYECVGLVPLPATSLAGFITLGGSAASDAVTVSSSDVPPLAPRTTTVRTYTISDGCNSTSVQQTIVINDTIFPVISNVPTNITVATGPGRATCDQVVTWITPTASDNCGIASFTSSANPGATFPVGTTTVTYTAIDTSGNTSTASFTVTVVDTTPPVLLTHPYTLTLNGSGQGSITPADVYDPASSDNCTAVSLVSVTPNTFTFCNVGANTVTLIASDTNGNLSTNVATVTVQTNGAIPAIVYVDTNYTGPCGPVPFPFNGGSGTYYIGYNAFPSIQAGLNAVASGGTVVAAPETFQESPNITQPVTLTSIGGVNAANTFIALNPANLPATYLNALTIGASDVSVEGFTIVGYDAVGAGQASTDILLQPLGITNIDIGHNVFLVGNVGPDSDGDDGMGVESTYNTDAPFVDKLVLHDNTFMPVDNGGSASRAFYINPGVLTLIVSNNVINGNFTHRSWTLAANGLVIDNTVNGTGSSYGLGAYGDPDPNVWGHTTFASNTISGTVLGISLFDSVNDVVKDNLLSGNGTAIDMEDYDGGFDSTGTQIFDNNLMNASVAGLANLTAIGIPNAANNWWGDVSGPTSATLNPYGIGSSVVNNATVAPWLASGVNTIVSGPGFVPGAAVNYPPTQLVITVEPGGANLGALLSRQPVVQVEDLNGNVTPWANPDVTLTLNGDPTGALAGTNPELAVTGIATFTDLSVTLSGGFNLSLTATAPYLTSASSNPFNITNPAPSIASITPFFGRAGSGDFILTVNGANFVNGSIIAWNGTNLIPTLYVSSTQLSATVPSNYIASIGTAVITVTSPGPGGGTTGSLPFTVDVATPPITYVDVNYTGLASNTLVNWPSNGVAGPHIIGYDAFATIEGGVTNVATNGTVNVAAGKYAEEVTIDRALSLIGPNATINPNTGTRVAEAIIQPDVSDPEIYDSTAVVLLSIASSDVTIKGFTIDGYNPALNGVVLSSGYFGYVPSGTAYLGTYYASGTNDFNAATGIADYNGDSSIQIENNIVKNDAYAGIDLESDATGQPTANSYIKHNLIENIDYNAEGFGDAVILYNNYYAEISENSLVTVGIGITPQNFWLANTGSAKGQLICSNNVSASLLGIWLNLTYDSASTFLIKGNTSTFALTNGAPLYGPAEWDGIAITSIQSSAGVIASNNTVTGPAAPAPYNTVGYNVWNTPTTNQVLITGGSVSQASYGVWVNDYDGYQSAANALTAATVSGVNISGSTVAGVYVQDDPLALGNSSAPTHVTVTGNTVITGSPVGVLAQGTLAQASVVNNSASITGNAVGVKVDTGVAMIQNNDLTGNTSAAIVALNGAKVDAGDCTGANVTGLGSSSGGNNLSGYSFNSVAPLAIENFNASDTPVVLAENDNFGALAGTNITTDFNNPAAAVYSQNAEVLVAPTDVTVVCPSYVPLPATTLSGLIAQGGYFSASTATVSSLDSTVLTNSGTIIRTYTVVDACGVPTLASQSIKVNDTVPPVFVGFPTNTVANTGPGRATCDQAVFWVPPTATDNCGYVGITSDHNPGDVFPVGVQSVTYVATDSSGNSVTNSFTVTVNDTTPPAITACAPNTTINADTNAQAQIPSLTNQVAATDNCEVASITQSPLAGTTVGLGDTQVTLTVTDIHGNTNSCVATVTVKDVTPPTLACAPNATVSILQSKDPYFTGTPTATDAGGSVTITYNDDRSGLTNCDSTGVISRTWTATDPSGNASTCVQTITVVDTNAPYFTFVPASITTTNDLNSCGAVVAYATPTAEDLGYAEDFSATNWVSGDYANNPSVDWNDYNSHVYRVGSGTNGITALNSAAYSVIDSTVAPADGDSTGAFTRLGGYSAVFGSGYRVSQDVYINLNDPQIVNATETTGYAWDLSAAASSASGGYYRDFIIHAAAYGPGGVVIAASNGSSDSAENRGPDLRSGPYGTISQSGWYTFQWVFRSTNGVLAADLSVTDTNGNTLFTQTLSDPSDAISGVGGHRYLWFTFINTDELPIGKTTLQRDIPVVPSQASGTSFAVGTTTVVLTAADACGNSITNTNFSITVNDVQPPTANVPANITQGNDHGQCGAIVNFTLPAQTDNCGVAGQVATPASGTFFAVGTTTVTNVVTDIHGNSATNTFTVTVNDTEAPSANVPGNIVQNNDPTQCGAIVNFTLPAQTDNCGVAGQVATPASGTFFAVGTTTVTNVVTDIHGNSATNTFTVTVNDTEPPVAMCPANIVQGVDPNQTYATVNFTIPSATDNCGILNVYSVPPTGSHFGIGTNVVTVVATDIHGNTNACSFTVTVIAAPTLACAPDVTVSILQSKDPYFTGTPAASSTGGPVTITYNDDSSGLTNCDSTGKLLRTWTATDVFNNTNDCVQTITVVDTNAPYFTFVPTSITTTNDLNACGAVVAYATPTAMDLGYFEGFENPSFASDDNDQSWDWNDYPSHVARVTSGTYGITANSGGAFAIVDSTVPGTGPGVQGTGAYSLLGGGNAAFGAGYRVALDVYVNLSDTAVLNATPTSGYGFDLDTGTQTYNGANGGYGRDYIFHTAAYGTNGVVIGADNNSSNEASARRNDLLTLPNHATLTNTGWYTFEWIFRNTNGVLAADLNVRDVNQTLLFSQTLSDPSDAITNSSGNPFYLWFNFVAVDKLPIDNTIFERIVPVTPSQASGTSFAVGTTTVVLTATDACGNSITNTNFSITVNDVQPPTANVPANITQGNDHGQCGAIVNFTLPAQTDNCGVAGQVATPASGTFFAVGTTTVTNVVTDIHGNSATNTFTVTVNDTEAPSANVPSNIVQNNDPGQCSAVVIFTLPSQTDNCNVAGQVATPPSGSTFAVGTNVVTVVVTDIHGNSATNTFTVTVNDTELPVIQPLVNLVQGVDPGTNYATVIFPPITATDNCGVLSVIAVPASGSQFPVGTNTVLVTATDIHGNVSTNSFTVAVIALPTIVNQPVSRTNNAGTPATFSVVATNPAPLSYHWLKNGSPLGNGGNISGATNATLTISGVSDTDVATYSVVVSDLAGSVTSSNATLTVIDPPVITVQPASVTNNATTTATFSVTVSGTTPFTYQWYFNGTNALTNGGNISGATNSSLTISNVLAANQGAYSVTVSNPAGTTNSTNAQLVVIDPYITVQPVGVTKSLGSPVSFSVTAVGTQPLSYQWQQNGIAVVTDTNHIGASSATLSIGSIQDSDAGTYQVIVTNSVGVATSVRVVLVITHPPVIVSQPASLTVNLGQSASFQVSANGTTPFTYQWQKNGTNLTDGTNIVGSSNKKLILNSASASDAGSYTVIVNNADGTTNSLPAILTVIIPPAFVTQPVSLTNNAGTTAVFGVTTSGTAPHFQWYMNVTNLLTNSSSVSGATSNILTISNVLGANQGTYSVVISNAAGTATSSNATLVVIDPIITNEPVSMTVDRGQPASFNVGAYGTSPQYQWRQNGTNIAGATASVYSLASAADSDAGSYTVVVSNSYGTVTSAPPATLTVIDPAQITAQPTSRTNNAGTTATFTVGVSGTAPIAYEWMKNGTNILGATNATLTLNNVQDADAASYTVYVSNIIGNQTSTPATLTVIDPPIITNEPASRTNNAGTTATFTVAANGTSPSYQWLKNGNNIPGATNATLTLNNVQDPDVASYTVYVSNAAGNQTSTPATLTVIDAPIITGEPASRTNNAGTTATFTVVASGTSPSYQWMKNGNNILGATNALLSLANVQDADAASYTVYVSNAAGNQTSTPATLTVIDPPVITNGPASRTNLATTTATFTVLASGTSPSYQWFKNGTNQLMDGGKVSGSTSNVLTITNVLGADQASYTVVVSNAAGVVTSSNALLVVIDPAILAQPVSITNLDGSTVSFTVTAVGTQPLSYQWQQDGGDVEGATDATLTLTDIADSDAGNYTVIITNSVGSITSAPAALVTVPPLIVTEPSGLTVIVGQSASFSVGVNGAIPFSYQWMKNGTNIAGETNRNFVIGSTALTDGGNYQVVVSNPVGSQTSQIAILSVLTGVPNLRIVNYSNGVATVVLTGVTGYNYAIQGSTDLLHWIPIITNPAPYILLDTNMAIPDKYYRGHLVP
jgi:hypothetical protein